MQRTKVTSATTAKVGDTAYDRSMPIERVA